MADARFIIDTNILVESHRREYAFDICPGFWDLMEKAFCEGLVISHAKVRKEIMRSGDELSRWVKGLNPAFFPDATVEEFAVWQRLCSWVSGRGYSGPAIAQFTNQGYADPWVCAKAKNLGLILVTQEVSAPFAKKSIKLPDACASVGVSCCDTFDMLRWLKARFVLDTGHAF